MLQTPRARAERALRQCSPELVSVDLHELGGGLDHGAFVAGELVVRVSCAGESSLEAELLALVARHVSIPVPAPYFADPEHGVLAYPLIPGRSLLGRAAPAGAASELGRFLRELHGIDAAEVRDVVPSEVADPDEWLAELTGPASLLDVLRIDRPEPSRQFVLAHADLGAEHILVRDGAVTGVIDWSDAALSDPALDFARLYRDFGSSFLDEALSAYGRSWPGLRSRIQYFARCAALEDLAYGRESGKVEYS